MPARVGAPPFGAAWLRGLTLSRVGLVAALCFIFSIRQGVSAADHDPWIDVIWNDLQFAALQMLCLTPIMLLVTIADNASASAGVPTRVAALTAAVCLGAATYAILYWSILGSNDHFWEFFRSMFMRVVAWGGFLTSALFFVERERQMTEATQRAQQERVDFERQFEEARLRLLEAQIEPHFLFNTLANIKGLCRDDPLRGRRMLLD
ncbi:MAG: histidine kinase, partial [Casimicrobiaceae bacterium]